MAQTENTQQSKSKAPTRRVGVQRLVMFFRRHFQCRFGTHWNMKYDSGMRNDIGGAGTCSDCGYRTEGITWPRTDNSDLIDLLEKATKRVDET